MNRGRVLIGVSALLFTLQSLAHHSGAMFDDKESTTLSGTVKDYQWTNPHCWIQVLVPGAQGPIEWASKWVRLRSSFGAAGSGAR